MEQNNETHCADCGAAFGAKGCGTGYGTDSVTGERHCDACCGEREKARMIRDGKATLYLVRDGTGFHAITDWPGTLRFPATAQRFRHPFAREAWLGRFKGPDGAVWGFKNIGDSQLAHCRRLKGS